MTLPWRYVIERGGTSSHPWKFERCAYAWNGKSNGKRRVPFVNLSPLRKMQRDYGLVNHSNDNSRAKKQLNNEVESKRNKRTERRTVRRNLLTNDSFNVA